MAKLMSLDQFFETYNGKGIDWDGAYGFQCVDLYRQYVHDVLGYPQSPGVRGAKDIWNNYLKTYFDRIENTPNGIPKRGDIVIWNSNMGGGYGHIAVVLKADLYSLTVFEQDGTIGSTARENKYSYFSVIGWLTPKIKQNAPLPGNNEGGNVSEVPKELQRFGKGSNEDLAKYIDEQVGFVDGGRRQLSEIRTILGLSVKADHKVVLDKIIDLKDQIIDEGSSNNQGGSLPVDGIPSMPGFAVDAIHVTYKKEK